MKRFMLLAATCAAALPAFAQNIATVNGNAITEAELNNTVKALVARGAQDTPEFRKQLTEELINRAVLVQAAEKAGVDKKDEVALALNNAKQEILIASLLQDWSQKNQISDAEIQKAYDEIVKANANKKEYKVKHLKYFTVDTESQALKIIKDCTSEESFTNYFNENSGTDAGLVTKESSSVDSKIIKKLDKFTKDGIYAKAIKTSESKYAIVWVYNTDKSNLKDEIKESLTSISNFSTKCETSYLRKYNFDVYEPSIKKKIKKSSKDYFE